MSGSPPSSRSPATRRLGWVASLLAIGGCAVWAFLPPRDQEIITTQPRLAESATATREPFDLAAFSAPIWYVPPPPPALAPEPEPRRLPPFDLELIAIVEADGASEAVFYDPRADVLVHVSVGQTLGDGRVVDAIGSNGVRIRENTGIRTVALEGPAP